MNIVSETLGLIDVGYTRECGNMSGPPEIELEHVVRLLPDGSEMDVLDVLTEAEEKEIRDRIDERERSLSAMAEAAIEDAAEAKMLQRNGVW